MQPNNSISDILSALVIRSMDVQNRSQEVLRVNLGNPASLNQEALNRAEEELRGLIQRISEIQDSVDQVANVTRNISDVLTRSGFRVIRLNISTMLGNAVVNRINALNIIQERRRIISALPLRNNSQSSVPAPNANRRDPPPPAAPAA